VTRQPALEARQVSKHYGGLHAVTGVSFTVSTGEILGIVGPNGAGKTTLFDVISGHVRATSGDVLLDGRPVTGTPVHRRARLGLARTFQQPTAAGSLTVGENMLLASTYRRKTEQGTAGTAAPAQAVAEFLGLVGMDGMAERPAAQLGVFDLKRLMLATALAMNCRVLLLDEPFGGLSPAEIDQTIGLLRKIPGRGIAVVCIEHVMRALTSVAGRVLVMDHGATLFEGTPAQMLADDRVIEVYLGARHRKQGGPP
jgi:branched-chain amino acid transport system ATP-binding protein